MARAFLQPDDLRDLVAEQFGTDRGLAALDRLTGGSRKKGVYRLGLDDQTTMILYVWAAGENYWPPSLAATTPPWPSVTNAGTWVINSRRRTTLGRACGAGGLRRVRGAGPAARAKSARCACSASSSCRARATASRTLSEAPARLPRSSWA